MTINLQRRKSVMARSMKLGHCVCNPLSPCPCDTFRLYTVCPCAGEKLPARPGPVALTRFVGRAGCASKIGQADLARILSHLPPVTDPNILVGIAAGDDAGVYRIDDRRCLVQTVDVFTPCVDDAYLFGQIAAANSLSDVYAMGGRPLTALSIVGFPIDDLDGAILEEMLRGGMQKLEEAGCVLIGGHSLQDEEVKLGFAVTGLIEASAPVVRAGAQPGDVLVITKPIGTGMVAFAAQLGRASAACLEEVGTSMATLNKEAAELMVRFGAHACTDVTGFGLAGHLVEMVRGSSVDAEIDLSALPVFRAAVECIARDILSGAIERNQEYAMAWIETKGRGGKEAERNLAVLYDPQTSGGLLVALPPEHANRYVAEMRRRGHRATGIIGRVVNRRSRRREGRVVVIDTRLSNLVGQSQAILPPETSQPPLAMATCAGSDAARLHFQEKERILMKPSLKKKVVGGGGKRPQPVAARTLPEAPCCAGEPTDVIAARETMASKSVATAPALGVENPLAGFQAFMKAANAPGRIDRKAKKLMAVALSIALRCEPCLQTHLHSALAMGITREEIEEAAALAISFGGCTAMMFYKDVTQAILK